MYWVKNGAGVTYREIHGDGVKGKAFTLTLTFLLL